MLVAPRWPDSVLARLARGERPTLEEAYALSELPLDAVPELMDVAAECRNRRGHRVVTFSRSVFIPLTNVCRDRCAYCTFRRDPGESGARIVPPDEVVETVRRARALGCTEVLLSLGDKPDAFAWTRETVARWGYRSMVDYLVDTCRRVAYEEGLFPHTNAGLMGRALMRRLRPYNLSMGVMVESVSPRLLAPGGPHHEAPDKHPSLRLRMLEDAGVLRIPFTTGMLVGIGESRSDWVDTLWAIREVQARHGHIQEVIVQNFRAKPGTPMEEHPEPSEEEYLLALCLSRFILGPEMNIQAPPNLNPGSLKRLLQAGVNDWGGVSPLTIDYINPEAPWPTISRLREVAGEAGFELKERLPVYPEFLVREGFVHPDLLERALAVTDSAGYVREQPDGPFARRGDTVATPLTSSEHDR